MTGKCAKCGKDEKLGTDGACKCCHAEICADCWTAAGHECPICGDFDGKGNETTGRGKVTKQAMRDKVMAARETTNGAMRIFKAAEKEWTAAANARQPDIWREAIDGIADMSLRVQVACIVWWDYFGSRPMNNTWPQLDDYKAAWKSGTKVDFKKVRQALCKIGYPDHIADRRGRKVKESSDEVQA